MEPLKELTRITNLYRKTKTQKQYVHRQWCTWNHWASNQPEYFVWAADNGLKPSELKARKHYDNIEIIYDMGEGAPLYALRHQLEYELELLRYERSNLLKTVWFAQQNGQWIYPASQIAEAIGLNTNALMQTLFLQPWFKPRRELSTYGYRWPK